MNDNNYSFQRSITVGPRIGINVSTLSGVSDDKAKPGLVAGVFMVYSVLEHFGLSADLLFSGEGSQYKDNFSSSSNGVMTDVKTTNKLALNYLRMPLQAIVFFGDHGNALRPKLSVGPTIGVLLTAKNKYSRTTTVNNGATLITQDNDQKLDMKNYFTPIDFGAMAAAGFNYKITEGFWLNFDLRYYIGATDINDSRNFLGTNTIKNNSFSATAGIGIGL